MNILIMVIAWITSLVALGCFIYVIVKMFQHDRVAPAIGSLVGILACGLGFLFAFVYGWTKASEWNIKNVMIAWSAAILVNLGLNVITLPTQLEAIRQQQAQMQGGNVVVPNGGAPAPVIGTTPANDPLPAVEPAPVGDPAQPSPSAP